MKFIRNSIFLRNEIFKSARWKARTVSVVEKTSNTFGPPYQGSGIGSIPSTYQQMLPLSKRRRIGKKGKIRKMKKNGGRWKVESGKSRGEEKLVYEVQEGSSVPVGLLLRSRNSHIPIGKGWKGKRVCYFANNQRTAKPKTCARENGTSHCGY